MASSIGKTAIRIVWVVNGVLFTACGVGVLVLGVGVPTDLLYVVPSVGRWVLDVAPWLVARESSRPSGSKLLFVLFLSAVFTVSGLAVLGKGLFGDADSLSVRGGAGGHETE
ncbi:MAG: hypothetical protein ABEJ42_04815 [Halobacteriaceae archaeon]